MPAPITAAVVELLRQLTPHVFALDLRTGTPLTWTAGQWASLHLPVGPHPPLVRAYTLAEPPDGTDRFPLVFDIVDGGLGSEYLAGLRPADTVEVAAITGKFVLPDPLPEGILFGARLTGIVPIRAMLLDLAARENPPRVRLVYGAPSAADLVFHEELVRLELDTTWFEYFPVVQTRTSDWGGPAGDELSVLRLISEMRSPYVPMLSGVRAFTQPARQFLIEERGFERRQVRVESYD